MTTAAVLRDEVSEEMRKRVEWMDAGGVVLPEHRFRLLMLSGLPLTEIVDKLLW